MATPHNRPPSHLSSRSQAQPLLSLPTAIASSINISAKVSRSMPKPPLDPSTFVLIFFYAAFELLAAGAGPLIARATGAKDTVTRRALLGGALFGALLLTGVLMIVGVVGAPLIATALRCAGRHRRHPHRVLVRCAIQPVPHPSRLGACLSAWFRCSRDLVGHQSHHLCQSDPQRPGCLAGPLG
jgi:hypothetical protein